MAKPTRVAIVTGGGSGIGRATVIALAREGYAVAIAGRRLELLRQTASLCGDGENVLPVQADVADEQQVSSLFERCIESFGRLDLLFNNAGTGVAAAPDALSLKDWQRVVDTNLTGTFLCARAAFRCMKSQDPRGGRIINNGSISAHAPRPNSIAYTATKHAITGLTKSIALDGRRFDIACGQIDIGNAATEMTARMAQGVPQANGENAAEPVIDVAHVAKAIVHMASLPLDANVQFLTLMATKMPFIGRG